MRSEAGRAEPREPPAEQPQSSEESQPEGSVTQERRLAWWMLSAVGVAYLVAQLALVPSGRPPGWDEAVYLSQVTPGIDGVYVAAWRARGITLLIAPVTLLGGSLTDVRLYLAILSATTVTLTFRLWIPLIGMAAPVVAVLFSFTWLSLVNGSAVMPNFWAAILGVAAAGLVARRMEGGSLRHAVLASVVLGAMALARPVDATVVAGAIGLYVLVVRSTSWRVVVGLGVGLVLGWLPWAVEMSIRFGGVVGALREANAAGHLSVAPVSRNVLGHLWFTYGLAKPPPGEVPEAGLLWWGLLFVTGVIALRRQVAGPARSVALLGWLATCAIAIEYLVIVPYTAGRFLLPAYAFVAIPAAIGLVSLLREGVATGVIGAAALALVIPWAVWQGSVGSRVAAEEARSGQRFVAAGSLLRDLADGRPCSFVSPAAHPQIQLASGCVGDELRFASLPTRGQRDALAAGEEVFIILPERAGPDSPIAVTSPVPISGPERTWFIYRLSEPIG